jgi:DNA-directed RNA polymerase subunit RPC12/RpoP
MTDPKAFTCPTCGASLDVAGKYGNVPCPYCGNNITIEKPPIGLDDLAAEQNALVSNMMQSAMDMQSRQAAVASNVIKTTMPVVVGSTIVLPIVIGAIILFTTVCIIGMVLVTTGLSLSSMFH